MTEEEAIELLNEIDNEWRDKYDTPWEALECLGYKHAHELGVDLYEELDFDD